MRAQGWIETTEGDDGAPSKGTIHDVFVLVRPHIAAKIEGGTGKYGARERSGCSKTFMEAVEAILVVAK